MANFLSNAIGAVTGIGRPGGLGKDPVTENPSTASYMNAVQAQDQSKPAYSVGGVSYNFAGDPIKSSAPSTSPSIDAQIKAAQDAVKALQYQIAQQPKLPFFDTSANWAKSQAAAGSVVNPVYTDKLNAYLQKQALQQKQQTETVASQKEQLDTSLNQSLQDSSITRTRTAEDVATKLGDIGANETSFQTQEGNSFDKARAALLGTIANSGLTESGLGQGQDAAAITDRNLASADQTRTFDNQKRDTELFKTRTFDDLQRTDTRATEMTSKSKQLADKQLQDYIDGAVLDEQKFRTDNESSRLTALLGETMNQSKLGVNNFIAALVGSGARAQDIALAKQIYG